MPVETDYSQSYNELRQKLIEETGEGYRAFLKSLKPDYKRVWLDIGFGYVMLALTLFAVQLFKHSSLLIFVLPAGAVMIGFWVAYLHLFLHEGSHYNLAADRRRNDLLCDLFISWLIGTCVYDFRFVHFQHHRKLGERDDSERSYFNALTWRFLLETFTGVHALRVFLFQKKVREEWEEVPGVSRPKNSRLPLILDSLAHLALILCLLALGAWPAAVTWIVGVGIFFAFFATLRQILEHRAADAEPSAKYAEMPHGAVARLFGDDLFSRTFGGAGFNRHLLHHWEPQISYTCLKDFEDYLAKTSAAPLLNARRGSYWRTFRDILRNDNARP